MQEKRSIFLMFVDKPSDKICCENFNSMYFQFDDVDLLLNFTSFGAF